MWINNARIFPGGDIGSIEISNGLIASISNEADGGEGIDAGQSLLTPGLINSHEHLEFDLYPMLGQPPYKDYIAWAEHIHEHYHEEIKRIENIPRKIRAQWGILRNLLHGVTTVVNHGEKIELGNPPITILNSYQDIHSIGFEKNWKWRLNDPRKLNEQCVIHVGEGISTRAKLEINELIRANYLGRKIVAVHAVAMEKRQAKSFHAIVWCPATNQFMLGSQPAIEELQKHTPVLFGTDSTLTSGWDIRNHLRLARELEKLPDAVLIRSCTSQPARIWKLNTGTIAIGQQADLVLSKADHDMHMHDQFFSIAEENIDCVMHKGNIVLSSNDIYGQLHGEMMFPFLLHKKIIYLPFDVPRLMQQTLEYHPGIVFPFEPSVVNIIA